MKKLLFTIFLVVISLSLFSQERIIYPVTIDTMLISGSADTASVVLPAIVDQWDISVALSAAIQGIGDSARVGVIVYQSNAMTGDHWVAISSDSTASDGSWVYENIDFNGLRLKLLLTGACLDTAIFTPYMVFKRKGNELPVY